MPPEDGSSDVTINGEDITVVADANLSIDGGDDVSVALIDNLGEISYPVISSYQLGNNLYSPNLTVNGNSFIFTTAPGKTSYNFNFAYPEGNYILPLYNPFDWSVGDTTGHVKVFLDNEPTLSTQSLKIENADTAFNQLMANGGNAISFTYSDSAWKVNSESVNLSDYGLEEADTSRLATTLQFGDNSDVITTAGSVVDATFITKVGTNNFANYDFVHEGADWKLDGNVVTLSDYGITYTGTSNFTVQYMPHQLFEIDDATDNDFNKSGYHYIFLPVMKSIEANGGNDMVATQHTIRFYFDNPSETSTYVSTLYGSDRIVDPENSAEIMSDASAIKTSLTGQNIKFKYNYRPGENGIKDPLASTSFLNKNHIYNKFTICKASTPFIIQIVK